MVIPHLRSASSASVDLAWRTFGTIFETSDYTDCCFPWDGFGTHHADRQLEWLRNIEIAETTLGAVIPTEMLPIFAELVGQLDHLCSVIRGHDDALNLEADHDVAQHSQYGSIQPSVAETETLGTEYFFGAPVCTFKLSHSCPADHRSHCRF